MLSLDTRPFWLPAGTKQRVDFHGLGSQGDRGGGAGTGLSEKREHGAGQRAAAEGSDFLPTMLNPDLRPSPSPAARSPPPSAPPPPRG